MFWDGERWVPEKGPVIRSKRPASRNRLRRWLVAMPILFLVTALIVPVVSTEAATYHPRVVAAGAAEPGGLVTLTGSGTRPGGYLQARLDRAATRLGLIRVDRRGGFSVQLRLPSTTTPGTHLVTIGRVSYGGLATASIRSTRLLAQTTILSVKVNVKRKVGVSKAAPPPAPAPTASPSASPTAPANAVPAASPAPDPTPAPAPTAPPTPPAASCAGTLQSEIDAAPAGSVLDLTGCTYATGATVNKALTIRGATIRPPAGTAGLVVTANDVTLDGLHIIGVQATTYNANEVGVEVRATAAAPVRRLTIRNSEIANFGFGGTYLRQVSDLVVENNNVHDGVYAGIMVLSGRGGRITGNTVQRIGMVGSGANSGNAYGIALTRGFGTLATEPTTADFLVDGNTVEDVPTWHAIDTHAGERITFSNNMMYRVMRGIYVTSDDNNNLAHNIAITGNRIELQGLVASSPWALTVVFADTVLVNRNTSTGYPAGQWLLLYPTTEPGYATNVTVASDNVALP
jgi:parallel beta-helix repeat protein